MANSLGLILRKVFEGFVHLFLLLFLILTQLFFFLDFGFFVGCDGLVWRWSGSLFFPPPLKKKLN